MSFTKYLPDRFSWMLIGTVVLASVLPASGVVGQAVSQLASVVIFLLFFLHGVKLSRPAIWEGISHWRLHLFVTTMTFVFFPIVGWALRPVLEPLLGRELYLGVLFLCCVPATVQSAIALTALAKGNMPAAICSASASTLMGTIFTPLLVGLLLNLHADSGSNPLEAIGKIAMQLLLPFVIGHLLRPWVFPLVQRHSKWVKVTDQSSILLVVYAAFSSAVLGGIWQKVPVPMVLTLLLVCLCLLALAMLVCIFGSRRLGFDKADEAAILFCGAQKSLVSGVPMAMVLFPGDMAGMAILPLMMFHPMQLIISAYIAGNYGRNAVAAATATAKA